MHLSGTLGAATLTLLCICAASAQTGYGVVRGEVIDSSGGVLPGVTVVATSADERILATTVTDHVGRYVLRALPAGPIKLAFELTGFDTAAVSLVVQPGAESWVVERLKLARMTEEVVVYGTAPIDPPLPRVPYVPPPPPTVIPVPPHELESVCGPRKPSGTPETFGMIHSHRYEEGRTIYTKGDELIIDGGAENSLEVGRNLVVRRYYRANGLSDVDRTGEHTAGVVQIVATNGRFSTAVVVYACNELMRGDLLGAFTPELVRMPDPVGTPDYEGAARILFADAGQMLGVPRRLMVIDRGSEQGIQPGQRLTLFRREGGTKPFIVGEAIVISVQTDSATIRVVGAIDAIWFGDWAAPQRQ